MNGQQWILDLKVGDPVYVTWGGLWVKTTVTKKTPTGRITVERGGVFNAYGGNIGTQSSRGLGPKLQPWSQKQEDQFAVEKYRENLVREFRKLNDSRDTAYSLSNDQLERILAIVNENNKPKEGEK